MTHNFTNNIFHPDTRDLLYTKCTHCGARDNDEVARIAPCPNAPTGAMGGGGSGELKTLTKAVRTLDKTLTNLQEVLEEIADNDGYDHISASSRPRDLKKSAYTSKYGVAVADLQCMITGKSQNSVSADVVILAHLIPRCFTATEQSRLGFDYSDIENIRNSILLCQGLEDAFARKCISFVPSDVPFSPNRYKLHIWCDKTRSKPIYEGATETIGDFDNSPLILNVGTHAHDPFKRAMSYQAFRAFKKWAKILNLRQLPENSDLSVYEGSYKETREKYASQLAKDILDECDSSLEDIL